MTALVRYEAARYALQVAHSVDEVKDIRDKVQAMAAYARQAGDTELVEWATEIKVRAERRAGELTREIPTNPRARTDLSGSHGDNQTKKSVLADLGVTEQQANRWEKLAAVPEDKFELAVAAAKEVAGEVTTAAMLRLSQPHVAHNSGENEWYTPPEFIEAARAAMGAIDTDPASSAIANRAVKAEQFFTAEQNGLEQEWAGKVWMNPPYAQPLVSQFCDALVKKFQAREIEQACVLVNNATETGWFMRLAEASDATCFTKGRVRFIDPQGSPSGAPLQGQAIVYFGGNAEAFAAEFSKLGYVYVGRPLGFV